MECKMKKTGLVILMVLLSFLVLLTGCSKKSKVIAKPDFGKTDLQEMNIKGEVSSLREVSYSAVDKFGTITRDQFVSDEYHAFNEDGFITERIKYLADGTIEYRQSFKRDEKMKKLEMNQTDSTGKDQGKFIYKNDDQGNNTELTCYSPDNSVQWKYIYDYDSNNNVTEDSYYGSDGTLSFKNLYTYDENNNKIDYKQYNNNSQLVESSTYEYAGTSDVKIYSGPGKMKESVEYDADDEIKFTRTYSYGMFGDRIEQIVENANLVETSFTDKYEYGEDNNWTKKVAYRNGIPYNMVDRSYDISNNAPKVSTDANAKPVGNQSEISKVATEWNRAHNEVNKDLFSSLYADQVSYYGKDMTGNKAASEKNQLLSNSYKGYVQEISDISVKNTSDGKTQIDFTKKSIFKGKTDSFKAYLVVENVNGVWKIIKESDETTDRNLK